MFRTTSTAPRKTVKSLVSAFAMTLALAGGAAVSNAAYAPAASAQSMSKAFTSVYNPVVEVLADETADVSTVAGQLPAVVAAASKPDEMFAAGNLLLIAGNRGQNPAWQRQGIELQLRSGKVPEESVGQFQWFLGNLAFQAEDYAAARTALLAAEEAGWTQDDPSELIAATYFESGDAQGGIDYIMAKAAERQASGGDVPERLLLQGLASAYRTDSTDAATQISLALVGAHPTAENWKNTLQVINALYPLEPQEQLDLLRLMRETGAMSNRVEFVRYIEAADPRIMSNEVVDVLNEGRSMGEFQSGEEYYTEVNNVVQARMASDRREADSIFAEAQADVSQAVTAGDVLYSLDDFARAEQMYASAAQAGVNTQAALTRLGIAQVKQGKYAEAQQTLARVTGARSVVAKFWSAYAASKAG